MALNPRYKAFYLSLLEAPGYRELSLNEKRECNKFVLMVAQLKKSHDLPETDDLDAAFDAAVAEANDLISRGLLTVDSPYVDAPPPVCVAVGESSELLEEPSTSFKVYEFHPAAELFPMMSETELNELVEDIKQNGLQHPIVLHEGLILDGRNRLIACERVGVDPTFVAWSGTGSPYDWVVSTNYHRRHLTETQRAFIAAELAKGWKTEARERSVRNLGKTADSAEGLISGPRCAGRSADEAAKRLGVSRDATNKAAKINRDGDDSLIQAAKEGEITLNSAYGVTDMPKANQRELVEAGKVTESAKQIRDAKRTNKGRTTAGAIAEHGASAVTSVMEVKSTIRQTTEGDCEPARGGGFGRPVLGVHASQLPERTLRMVEELEKELGPQAREVLLDPRYFATSTIQMYAELDLEAQFGFIDFVANGNARPMVKLLLVRKPAEVSPLVAGTCPTDAWGTFISKVDAIHAQFDALDGMVGNKVLNDEQVILALDGLSVKVRALKATRGKRAPHPESEASKAKRR